MDRITADYFPKTTDEVEKKIQKMVNQLEISLNEQIASHGKPVVRIQCYVISYVERLHNCFHNAEDGQKDKLDVHVI